MLKRIYVGIVLIYIVSLYSLQAQAIKMQHYGEDEGLVGQIVYDIAQDHNGIMWFLTDKGLNSYNGVKWDYIAIASDSTLLPSNWHSKIFVDSIDSVLYLYGRNNLEKNVLLRFRNNELKEIKSFKISNKKGVKAEYNTNLKELFVAYESGEVVLFDTNLDTIKHKNKYDIIINNISYYKNERIIYTDKVIYTLDLEGNINYKKLGEWSENREIFLIKTDRTYKNQSIAITFDEVIRFENYSSQFYSRRPIKISEKHAIGSYPEAIQTSNNVLIILNNSQLFISHENRFIERVIHTEIDDPAWAVSLFVDSEEVIWIGSTKGVYKVDTFALTFFDKSVGIEGNEVTALEEFNNGDIFIGNNNGFHILNSEELYYTPLNDSKLIGKRLISAVHDKKSDYIWVAGVKAGLLKINNDGSYQREFKDTIYHVDDILLKNDTLYVVNKSSQIYSVYEDKLSFIGDINIKYGFNKFYIRKLVEINNEIYMLTNNGIYSMYNFDMLHNYNLDIYPKNVYDIQKHLEDKLLIGSPSGLSLFDNLSSKSDFITISNDYISVYAIMKDKYNQYWLGTNSGIVVLDKDLNISKTINIYDGLVSNEINRGALKETSNGDIYIGTDKGLSIYRYYYDDFKKNAPSIKIHFNNSRSINNNTYIYNLNDVVNFTYDLTSYYAIPTQEYEYRLIGSKDEDWKKINRFNVEGVNFYGLNPGLYSIEVRSKNKNTDWVMSDNSYKFIVQTPFYQTKWFISIIVLLSICLILLFRYTYLQRSIRKNLEIEVDHKTRALLESNRQLMENLEEQKEQNIQLQFNLRNALDRGIILINNLKTGNIEFDLIQPIEELNSSLKELFKILQRNMHDKT